MAQVVLPLDADDPRYTVDVTLAGVLFRMAVNYNTRGDFWTFDLLTIDDAPIVASVKLVADWELLGQFNDLRLPTGFLYCLDLSGAGRDPGFEDLGTRVIVVYDDGQP